MNYLGRATGFWGGQNTDADAEEETIFDSEGANKAIESLVDEREQLQNTLQVAHRALATAKVRLACSPQSSRVKV